MSKHRDVKFLGAIIEVSPTGSVGFPACSFPSWKLPGLMRAVFAQLSPEEQETLVKEARKLPPIAGSLP